MTQESTSSTEVLSKRPLPITIICIYFFITAPLATLMSFFLWFTDASKNMGLGAWYAPYLLLTCIIGIASALALWKMRRLGFYLYTGMWVITQIIMTITGTWMLLMLVIPLIVILIIFYYLDQMK